MKSIREQSEQHLFSIAAIMAKTGQQIQEQRNGKTVHFNGNLFAPHWAT